MVSYGTKRYYILKEKAFEVLGKKCIKCGFDDLRILQFDHINGCTNATRKYGGAKLAYILKNPELYQLLCPNCNWIKRIELKENGDRWKNRLPPKRKRLASEHQNNNF